MMRRSLITASLCIALFATPAQAAGSWFEMAGSMWTGITTGISSAYDSVSRFFSNAVNSFDGSNMRHLVRGNLETDTVTDDSNLSFRRLMDEAGFTVKSVETTVGVIPGAVMVFGQAREITEADAHYVQRLLRKHARSHRGVSAIAERAIVRTILDIQQFKNYHLDEVKVTFLPLPEVSFKASPVDAPAGPETGQVLRAIDKLNRALATHSSTGSLATD